MIYKAFGYGDNTVHYIGNPNMMLCCSGAEFQSIRGGSYSSPSFGSITLCQGVESESERLSGTLIYRHSVYTKNGVRHGGDDPQLTFVDFIDPEKEIFIRNIHSGCDLTMKLTTPSYVRKSRFDGYKFDRAENVFVNVIPAGTCYFENFYCPDEIRMFIIAKGDCDFDGEHFRIRAGYSQIIMTTGTPVKVFENMRYALRYWQEEVEDNPIYRRSLEYWHALTASCPTPTAEATLISLLARQSCDGGIMSSSVVPMADTRAFYPTLCALHALGLGENAERLVSFYRNKLANCRQEGVHTYYVVSAEGCLPDVNQGKSAAMALRAFTFYYANRPLSADAARLMKDLFYISAQSLTHGMVAFSSGESEFSGGIIPRECMFQGSLSASVEVITACQEFLSLAKTRGIKLRDMASAFVGKLSQAKEELLSHFTFEDRIVANSLALEGLTKRPRYIYAKCPTCERQGSFACLTWLNRDKYGRYLCPLCMMRKDIPDTYSVDRISSTAPICELLLAGLSGEREGELLEIVKKRAAEYLSEGERLPARCAREDVLVSEVLRKYGIDRAEYDELLDYRADAAGTFPSLYVGEKCMGASGDSYPTSLYLLSLLHRTK